MQASSYLVIFVILAPTVTLNTAGVMVMEGGNQDLCAIISNVPTLGLACAINVTLSTAPSGSKGGEILTYTVTIVAVYYSYANIIVKHLIELISLIPWTNYKLHPQHVVLTCI